MHLRGEHHVLAPSALEGVAHDLLRLSARVDIRRIDEVHPSVKRAVDDPDALLTIGVSPRSEHHRPQAERTDLHPGAAERAELHAFYRSGRAPTGARRLSVDVKS